MLLTAGSPGSFPPEVALEELLRLERLRCWLTSLLPLVIELCLFVLRLFLEDVCLV